ncbi:GNAT family N-acetyltransferase [uncultured Azonexus sp.]|uniref:GNAT family N-acetyltransferase n=1 Tax=uncultured Azonexus sp. TaxID=520307 RepID=UPI00261E082C|nr:GNAT family N-acetyltransferase [uncultured Azonexus sp.]
MVDERKSGEVSVALLSETDDRGGAFREMVARGRGSLRFFLGDRASRQAVFADKLVPERILVARLNGVPAGYLGFQYGGAGPYAPDLRAFCRSFGVFSGLWRCVLFRFFEARTRHLGFYVYGLKVSRWARRRGVASALMLAAEAQARLLGAAEVFLEVHLENAGAREFYESLGYVRARRLKLGLLKPAFDVSGFDRLRKPVS